MDLFILIAFVSILFICYTKSDKNSLFSENNKLIILGILLGIFMCCSLGKLKIPSIIDSKCECSKCSKCESNK